MKTKNCKLFELGMPMSVIGLELQYQIPKYRKSQKRHLSLLALWISGISVFGIKTLSSVGNSWKCLERV